MRILVDVDGRSAIVDLQGWQPEATLGEFVAVAGGPQLEPGERLFLDGKPVAAGSALQDLVLLEGSVVSRAAGPVVQRIPGWSAAVAGGLAAGETVGVPEHRRLVAGRSPQADLVLPTESASWSHCTIELEDEGVRVRDTGSTNGTLVDGERIDAEGVLITEPATVLAGGSALVLRPALDEPVAPAPGSLRNLTPAATAPFNRPPRPGRPAPPEALIPPAPKEVPPASKFSLITVLAPLVMAGVLVVVLGDARFAMFAMLSPIMAIGMWFEQRRRRAKNLKEEEERFTQALAEFQGEMVQAAAVEALRRHDTIPDPATVLRRPALPSTLLWQRRFDAFDFLSVHVGVGDVPWQPELDTRNSGRLDDRVKQVLDAGRLRSAPVLAELGDAGVVGIVGDREGALALARSLVAQAAVHCGPADLTIGVFCDEGRERAWEWAGWLPHTRQAGSSTGARWMSNHREASGSMLRGLVEDIDGLPTPGMLIVIDSEVLTEGRDSPARDLLGHGRPVPGAVKRVGERQRQVSGIVLAAREDQLPASCTTVIEVGQDAAGAVHVPGDLTRVEDVVLAGVSLAEAERCARALARFDDPELVVPGASLPALVRLPDLLGVQALTAEAIRGLWESSPGVSAPVGLAESGPLTLDIVKDGPHGLVGGTTGSGKSEFLRSFVAGLAARNDPTRLNFILIDFKGGAAFTACERLPHTIGTISNLDEQLADRALRALEAEMERRQRLFAEAGEGVDNLPAYLATNPPEPLPRLLLVIDEFAMLAKDFPDVLASLVSVAAVGRTLGVHMILATQRPAGVVNDDILANTNLRVALRVQSREDSANVIGVPSASSIGRAQTGRAYIKLGQDDITPVQTALVTGRATQAAAEPVEVRQTGLFGIPAPRRAAPGATPADANDLDQLIDAIAEANARAGFPPPRQVWPDALGERVALNGYHDPTARAGARPHPAVGGVRDGVVQVALADEPDQQRQTPAGWDLTEGNLLLIGIPGSGTSTALASIALAFAHSAPPDSLDVLCLDVGSRNLSPLAGLPHTVSYVGAGPDAKEQQVRFLRHLREELNRRRGAAPGAHRQTLVLIDGLAGLRDEFQDIEGLQLLDALYRAYADGPALGLHFAITTTRAKNIPSPIDDVTTQRWVFRLADDTDYAHFSITGKTIPATVPGRCVNAATKTQQHIATPGNGLTAAVRESAQQWGQPPAKPDVIGSLPDTVPATDLTPHLRLSGEPLRLPIGIREDTLGPALLEAYEGEHILIAGPARSGKSTLLLALIQTIRTAPHNTAPLLWGIYDRRSPLNNAHLDRTATTPEQITELLEAAHLEEGRVFLLVDDAERVEGKSLASLAEATPSGVCLIVAGRAVDLRVYNSWTKAVGKSRCGVLLQPDSNHDGDLLGVVVPKRPLVAMTVGRGYMCTGGETVLVQTMTPAAEQHPPGLG